MDVKFMAVAHRSLLTFDGIVDRLKYIGGGLKDKRIGKNKRYDMQSVLLSAFSVFYLQSPSFLAHQKSMENDKGNSNARTLFRIDKIPTDNHMRDLLDEDEPSKLFPIFIDVFNELARNKLLDNFRGKFGQLLFAFDGVAHHHSNKIFCDKCKITEHANGKKSYSHGMVTAVMVKPGCPHVIDLPPEFMVPQDGHDKQDSEQAAIKRWLAKYAKCYAIYGVTVLGDDLYSHQPICELIIKENLHFILTCKPNSHKTLYENIEELRQARLLSTVEITRWTGKRREYDKYCFVNGIPLRDGNNALHVNWCELTTVDSSGKILYHNTFITDHKITKHNVSLIVEDGRARWKTENENNNTLKKHGYNLEHNFGHGKNNLSNVLATLNIIAFLCHTILTINNDAYQKIKEKLGARKRLFEHIRTLTLYILFDSWDTLLSFIMENLKLSPTRHKL